MAKSTRVRPIPPRPARSLFAKYQGDFTMLNRILDAYEPAATRIANTVAVGFVQERERVIRQQQEAIRELSTAILQVRERLLILVSSDPESEKTCEAISGARPTYLSAAAAY